MLKTTKELPLKRINEFEGLRALLAWWVFLGHALVFSGFTDPNSLPIFISWLLMNHYAVNLFMILSGFVIFLLLDSSPNKSYPQYMLERAFRIYPIFLIALIVGIASATLQADVFTHAGWNDPTIAQAHLRMIQNGNSNFFTHLIAHISLLHGMIPDQLLPDSSLTFISQSWSLSLEWQFYLVAPLLILCLRSSTSLWLGFLFLAMVIFSRKLFSQFSFGFGSFLPISMEFFVVGILSYYFYKFTQTNAKFASGITLPMILLASILGTSLFAISPNTLVSSRAIPITIWAIVLSAAISSSSASPTKNNLIFFRLISNFLNHPLLQKLGRASYSTYMLHLLIIFPLMWLVMAVSPDANKSIVLLVLLLFGSTLTIIVSFFLYKFVEKPFIFLGKQISERLKPE